jgi:hypothetical protein
MEVRFLACLRHAGNECSGDVGEGAPVSKRAFVLWLAIRRGKIVYGNTGQIAELPGCKTHELIRGGVALSSKAERAGGDACWRPGIDKGHLISNREDDVPFVWFETECCCHGTFFGSLLAGEWGSVPMKQRNRFD